MTDQLLFPGMEAARPLTDSLFFAVVPDTPARTRVGAITRELRDKYALTGKSLAERLHISLHGIGEFPSFPNKTAARAIEAAASVALPPFEITFEPCDELFGKGGTASAGAARRRHRGCCGIAASARRRAGQSGTRRAAIHAAPHPAL